MLPVILAGVAVGQISCYTLQSGVFQRGPSDFVTCGVLYSPSTHQFQLINDFGPHAVGCSWYNNAVLCMCDTDVCNGEMIRLEKFGLYFNVAGLTVPPFETAPILVTTTNATFWPGAQRQVGAGLTTLASSGITITASPYIRGLTADIQGTTVSYLPAPSPPFPPGTIEEPSFNGAYSSIESSFITIASDLLAGNFFDYSNVTADVTLDTSNPVGPVITVNITDSNTSIFATPFDIISPRFGQDLLFDLYSAGLDIPLTIAVGTPRESAQFMGMSGASVIYRTTLGDEYAIELMTAFDNINQQKLTDEVIGVSLNGLDIPMASGRSTCFLGVMGETCGGGLYQILTVGPATVTPLAPVSFSAITENTIIEVGTSTPTAMFLTPRFGFGDVIRWVAVNSTAGGRVYNYTSGQTSTEPYSPDTLNCGISKTPYHIGYSSVSFDNVSIDVNVTDLEVDGFSMPELNDCRAKIAFKSTPTPYYPCYQDGITPADCNNQYQLFSPDGSHGCGYIKIQFNCPFCGDCQVSPERQTSSVFVGPPYIVYEPSVHTFDADYVEHYGAPQGATGFSRIMNTSTRVFDADFNLTTNEVHIIYKEGQNLVRKSPRGRQTEVIGNAIGVHMLLLPSHADRVAIIQSDGDILTGDWFENGTLTTSVVHSASIWGSAIASARSGTHVAVMFESGYIGFFDMIGNTVLGILKEMGTTPSGFSIQTLDFEMNTTHARMMAWYKADTGFESFFRLAVLSHHVCAETTLYGTTQWKQYDIGGWPVGTSEPKYCVPTSQCNGALEYVSRPPTATTDRVCTEIETCDFETVFPRFDSFINAYVSKPECVNRSVACTSEQFEVAFATNSMGRACSNTTICGENEFELFGPTSTTDRICEAVVDCAPSARVYTDANTSICRVVPHCNSSSYANFLGQTMTEFGGCEPLIVCTGVGTESQYIKNKPQFEPINGNRINDNVCAPVTFCSDVTLKRATGKTPFRAPPNSTPCTLSMLTRVRSHFQYRVLAGVRLLPTTADDCERKFAKRVLHNCEQCIGKLHGSMFRNRGDKISSEGGRV